MTSQMSGGHALQSWSHGLPPILRRATPDSTHLCGSGEIHWSGARSPVTSAPLVVRIPWIFVQHLDLTTQRALLGNGDSVHAITEYTNRRDYKVGAPLVPAQS